MGLDVGLEHILKSRPGGCGAYSDNSFVIDPFGDIYKCWEEVGIKDKAIGNIHSEYFNYNYFKWVGYNPLLIDKCSKCRLIALCGGGCVSYGSHKDPYCYPVQKFLLELVKIYVEKNFKDCIK